MLLSPRESQVVELMGKRNALRHSFGSYRMEMVKNAGQVALEMGQLCRDSDEALLRHRGVASSEGVLEQLDRCRAVAVGRLCR